MDNTTLPMYDFYDKYYRAVESSRAHATLCEYAYGKNLAQHGFATMEQLDALARVTGLNASCTALDLGCGSGMIAEYLSDSTGARITGLDYIPGAVARASERTRTKRERLTFVAGDLTQPDLPPASFDVILSIDTIYFSSNYADTLQRWRALLRPHGQMGILFSHGVDPEHPQETFDPATLEPDRTPLADALRELGLSFQTEDFTRQDAELGRRKKDILERLKLQFEQEGNTMIYENRMGETEGVLYAIEIGMHARYLYHVALTQRV